MLLHMMVKISRDKVSTDDFISAVCSGPRVDPLLFYALVLLPIAILLRL